MEDDGLKRISELLKVLSVESRLRIVSLLSSYDSLCVNAISCRLGISQSAVSQHLRILHFSGFVTSEKDGYYTHYSLDRRMLKGTLEMAGGLLAGDTPRRPSDCGQRKGEKCAKTAKDA